MPFRVRFAPALVALALVAFASAPLGRAMCPMQQRVATMLTPLASPVPPDGALFARVDTTPAPNGVPVVATSDYSYDVPGLALVDGDRRVPMHVENVGSGLLRLAFARPPEPGDYVLEGWVRPGAEPTVRVRIEGTLPPAPAAPVVRAARHRETRHESDGPRGGTEVTITYRTELSLEGTPSDGAVIAAMRPAGRRGAWQLFTVAPGRGSLVDAGSLGGHCGAGPIPGRGRAWHRMRAELVVFDRFGRASPASAPFDVE